LKSARIYEEIHPNSQRRVPFLKNVEHRVVRVEVGEWGQVLVDVTRQQSALIRQGKKAAVEL
jgi:hypothetical protein